MTGADRRAAERGCLLALAMPAIVALGAVAGYLAGGVGRARGDDGGEDGMTGEAAAAKARMRTAVQDMVTTLDRHSDRLAREGGHRGFRRRGQHLRPDVGRRGPGRPRRRQHRPAGGGRSWGAST